MRDFVFHLETADGEHYIRASSVLSLSHHCDESHGRRTIIRAGGSSFSVPDTEEQFRERAAQWIKVLEAAGK